VPASDLPSARAEARDIRPTATPSVCGLASGLPVVCDRGSRDQHEFGERGGLGVLVDGFSEAAYPTVPRRLKARREEHSPSKGCRRPAETRYSIDLGVEVYHELNIELVGGTIPTERGG
jgi:hypothetical protein